MSTTKNNCGKDEIMSMYAANCFMTETQPIIKEILK